jgi:adenylate kinase family enzyme
MRKLLLIGPGGSGKSTLAKQLGERLGLPVIHLDTLYWRPGWIETPREEWRAALATLLAQDAWIMDGNFGGTLDMRLAAADTVILFDFPPLLCLRRVIRRRFRYHGRHRPDMAPGCNERIDVGFIMWIVNYRRRQRRALLPKLRTWTEMPGRRLVILSSPLAVRTFTESLTSNASVASDRG